MKLQRDSLIIFIQFQNENLDGSLSQINKVSQDKISHQINPLSFESVTYHDHQNFQSCVGFLILKLTLTLIY